MSQNYKVFVDNKVIIFTNQELRQIPILSPKEPINSYQELLKMLIEGYYQVVSKNPKKTIKGFFETFEIIKAAGGLVENKDRLLWIFRNGKWDLPKGKIEKEETKKVAASREVKEETGLLGELEIIYKIGVTYHVYFAFEKSILKETTWYSLHYEGRLKGIPQLDEGITQVEWFEKNKLNIPLSNTYPLIQELISESMD